MMEMIDRYVYAVTRSLPEAQRADIEQELRGLIEDLLEERTHGKTPTGDDVGQVLLGLGDPRILADKYRGHGRFLIGPELFTNYISVLQIVLWALVITMTVLFSIRFVTEPMYVLDHFLDSLFGILNGGAQAFAWVTLIFGVLEYTGAHEGTQGFRKKHAAWKLSDLPALPDERARIPRADPIASIFFIVLFAGLFHYSIDYLGVWRLGSSVNYSIPFFDTAVFRSFLPLIDLALALTIVKDIMKWISGRWTLKLVGFEILITIVNFGLAVLMFSDPSIWNPNFIQQLSAHGVVTPGVEPYSELQSIWELTQSRLLTLIGLVSLIQIITLVIRGIRIKNL